MTETIGLLHPGSMGSAIGAQLRTRGHLVLWCLDGRSDTTRRRAEHAGFEAEALPELVSRSDVLLSLCPPAAAEETAAQVGELGIADAGTIYVEANVVSPARVQRIADRLSPMPVIDAAVVGSPPVGGKYPTLYLSGPGEQADRIAELFAGTDVRPHVLDDSIGKASAFKLAYSSYQKVSRVLAAVAYGAADSYGVADELLEIAAKRTRSYLVEAVESLIQQPHTFPYEVVIVDDGSDDQPTLRAVAQCAERAGVRIVRQEHSGHHAARNAGINAASFEYVMQLDADDRLATAPELLKAGSYPDRAVKLLKTHQHVAFVHTMSRMIGDFDGLTISSYPCREELILRKHHVPTSIVCRRDDAIRGGLYDPHVRKWGDWAFAVNLLAGRFRRGDHNSIVCIAGPLHEYRVHTRTSRVSNVEISEFDMTLLVVEKNLDLFRHHFKRDDSAEDITRDVLASKPSRLVDLIRMAEFDLEQALTVARQREFSLSSPFECLGIP